MGEGWLMVHLFFRVFLTFSSRKTEICCINLISYCLIGANENFSHFRGFSRKQTIKKYIFLTTYITYIHINIHRVSLYYRGLKIKM